MIEKFANIVGEKNIIRDAAEMEAYLTEWRGTWRGRTPFVLKPSNTAEVAAILKLANETGTKIVTQGGNTGLTGAQIPHERGDEVLLSLKRLTAVREVDARSEVIIVEAGVTLAAAQEAAAAAGKFFPLSLASEGSATIGGNIATNAGGTAVVAYGNMRELTLGLEVVLANGEVWNGLKLLRKDNSGYDMKQVFIGSEGTLGVITAAALRLFPRPRSRAVALVALQSPGEAIDLYVNARNAAGLSLTALELMPRFGLELAVRHMGASDPFPTAHPWYALIEISGADEFDHYVNRLGELITTDAVLGQSEAQAEALWAIREGLSEAQKHEGPSIKHDVSVPVSRLPAYLDEALPAIASAFPEARPMPFGHAGDGNLHFNITVPPGFAQVAELNDLIHGFTLRHGGSVAAEHGVGRLKRELLARVKSPVEMEMMRGLKRMLDPKGILNPGKVV